MTNCSLTLIPFGKESLTIKLSESDSHLNSMDKIIEKSTSNGIGVFSDLSYEFLLACDEILDIQDVHVYINDAYEPSVYNNGHIRFLTDGTKNRWIFSDCYGFVKLLLDLTMKDGSNHVLSSEYLPVLVGRGKLNDSVKAMVKYVYNHQESLLSNGEPKPQDLASLKESGYRNLASQIILAEEIATIYETSYGFFKANSRFCIDKAATIDRLERLQYVTPTTIRYITSHPDQLRPVNSNVGVRVGNRVYQPQKTLSLHNILSYDIYENRVVLGFLRKMIDCINDLKEKCIHLLSRIPTDEDYSAEYIYSSFFMFAETRRTLETGMMKLSFLYDKFSQLWGMYRNIWNISSEALTSTPRPTAVLLSVPQYNKIFVSIYQWFNFGVYDFSREKFMLSFVKISSLYESYLLAKMVEYFKERGYTPCGSKQCLYPTPSKWKYKNTSCINTFSFYNSENRITLYYQPVIFNTDKSVINGIGLYRNNSIPIDEDDDKGAAYYTPDYLIKVDCNEKSKYLIIDAKFSTIDSVKKHYIQKLSFKYLFSISPIRNNDTIEGMCIIYGNCSEHNQLVSAYDKQLPNSLISPFADIIPLIEGINNETHYSKFDTIMRKMLQ